MVLPSPSKKSTSISLRNQRSLLNVKSIDILYFSSHVADIDELVTFDVLQCPVVLGAPSTYTLRDWKKSTTEIMTEI